MGLLSMSVQLFKSLWILTMLPIYFSKSHNDGLHISLFLATVCFVEEVAIRTLRQLTRLRLIPNLIALVTPLVLVLPAVSVSYVPAIILNNSALLNLYEAFLILSAPLLTLAEGIATMLVIRYIGKWVFDQVGENEYESSETSKFIYLVITLGLYLYNLYYIFGIFSSDAMPPTAAALFGSALTVLHMTAIITRLRVMHNDDAIQIPITDDVLLLSYIGFNLYLMSYSWNANENSSIDPSNIKSLKNTTLDLSILTGGSGSIFQKTISILFPTMQEYLANIYDIFGVHLLALWVYRTVVFTLAIYVLLLLNEDEYLKSQAANPPLLVHVFSVLYKPALVLFYTHSLLLSFGYIEDYSSIWKWINVFLVLGVNIIYGFADAETY